MDKKMKTIFSQRLAGHLMTKGFVLVGMEQGRNNSGKNVFYFNDSDELRTAMDEYKALNQIKYGITDENYKCKY